MDQEFQLRYKTALSIKNFLKQNWHLKLRLQSSLPNIRMLMDGKGKEKQISRKKTAAHIKKFNH